MTEDEDTNVPFITTGSISQDNVNELEAEFDEVKSNLVDITAISGEALRKLATIADAAQHPMYYDSLAKMILAATRANKEAGAIIAAKAELHKNTGGSTSIISNGEDGSVVVTTTAADVIGQILGAKKHTVQE